MDFWTIAREVDPIGQNSKGDLIRAIHNGTGWIKLSGDKDLLYKLSPGTKVRHGPVKVYGKSSFATLYEIEQDSYQRQKELSQSAPAPKPTEPPSAPRPEPKIMGGLKQPAAPTLTMQQAKQALFEFHKWAVMCEPEAVDQAPDSNPVYLDRAQARTAIVNTLMIALTSGKIQAPEANEPEIPGADAPMPDDEGFPWERAS